MRFSRDIQLLIYKNLVILYGMSKDEIPLFIVGLPKDEPNIDLTAKKFRSVLNRVEKGISKIHEARIAIKVLKSQGKRKNYQVSVLIKTQRRRFSYKDSGWDLSQICESIGQTLLRENTQNKKAKRQKKSIRKIREKIF